MTPVSKYVGGATMALVLMAASVSNAHAWSRSGSTTGPRGKSVSSSSNGSCSGGSCSRSGSVTGPRGGTAATSGKTNCSGGACTHTGNVTGPNGGSVTRSSTVSK